MLRCPLLEINFLCVEKLKLPHNSLEVHVEKQIPSVVITDVLFVCLF